MQDADGWWLTECREDETRTTEAIVQGFVRQKLCAGRGKQTYDYVVDELERKQCWTV